MPEAVAIPLVYGLAAIVRSRYCSGSRSIAATFVVLFSFAPKRAALITMLSPSLRRVMGKMWHACTTLQRGMRPGGGGGLELAPGPTGTFGHACIKTQRRSMQGCAEFVPR